MLDALLNRLNKRRAAYRALFLQQDDQVKPAARDVLLDLKRFCHAGKPTYKVGGNGAIDPLASAVAEGRREVWLRIVEHLELEDRFIVNLREEHPNEQ